MRLAETDAAVDEQRVVARARIAGRSIGCCVRQLIRRTDDERLEAVLWVQIRRRARRFRLALRRRRFDAFGAPIRFDQVLVDLPVDLDVLNRRLRAQRLQQQVEVVRADPVRIKAVRDTDPQTLAVEAVEADRAEPSLVVLRGETLAQVVQRSRPMFHHGRRSLVFGSELASTKCSAICEAVCAPKVLLALSLHALPHSTAGAFLIHPSSRTQAVRPGSLSVARNGGAKLANVISFVYRDPDSV